MGASGQVSGGSETLPSPAERARTGTTLKASKVRGGSPSWQGAQEEGPARVPALHGDTHLGMRLTVPRSERLGGRTGIL